MNIVNSNDSIERYLSRAMDQEEEQMFLAEVQENQELARELELRRRTNKILSDMSIVDLRGKLESIEMRRRSVNPARRAAARAAKYAAAVAGAAIIASSVYFPNMNVAPENLYERDRKSVV